MKRLFCTMLLLTTCIAVMPGAAGRAEQAQATPLRIIAFGAHPDDAELKASGVAALWAAQGHKVKFVAMTNGDVGHFGEAGGPLARRRKAEVAECARILGIENEVFDIHDGELEPTLEYRKRMARADPRVAGGRGHGPSALRLSPGPSLHGRPHGRHGGRRRRAVLRAGHAAHEAEPRLHVLLRQFSGSEAVHADTRRRA